MSVVLQRENLMNIFGTVIIKATIFVHGYTWVSCGIIGENTQVELEAEASQHFDSLVHLLRFLKQTYLNTD